MDSNNEISAKYGIRNIPTILFLKNGEVVDKQLGVAPKAALAEKLESYYKNNDTVLFKSHVFTWLFYCSNLLKITAHFYSELISILLSVQNNISIEILY